MSSPSTSDIFIVDIIANIFEFLDYIDRQYIQTVNKEFVEASKIVRRADSSDPTKMLYAHIPKKMISADNTACSTNTTKNVFIHLYNKCNSATFLSLGTSGRFHKLVTYRKSGKIDTIKNIDYLTYEGNINIANGMYITSCPNEVINGLMTVRFTQEYVYSPSKCQILDAIYIPWETSRVGTMNSQMYFYIRPDNYTKVWKTMNNKIIIESCEKILVLDGNECKKINV